MPDKPVFFRTNMYHKPIIPKCSRKAGVTETLVSALSDALTARELVKVRFGDGDAGEEAIPLAAALGCDVLWVTGHTAVLARLKAAGQSAVLALLDGLGDDAAASTAGRLTAGSGSRLGGREGSRGKLSADDGGGGARNKPAADDQDIYLA